jgi:peroxiredoxin
MHRNKTLVLLVYGLMTLLLSGLTACTDSGSSPVLSPAAEGKARDFVLKDLSGRKFMLSEHRGKPVLIVFSTTWCSTCRSEIPRYKHIYNTYTPRGLVMVGIDIEESQDRVSRFSDNYQLPYRVLLDDQGLVARAYQVVGVPAMVLIDANGAVISRQYPVIEGLLEKLFRDS